MKTSKANSKLVDQAWKYIAENLFCSDYHVEREFFEGLVAGENLNRTIRDILIENMKEAIRMQTCFQDDLNQKDEDDKEEYEELVKVIAIGQEILKKLKP